MLLVHVITFRPVPIRMDAVVSAFRSQLVFEGLDIQSVPRQKKARVVNLRKVRYMGKLKRPINDLCSPKH